MPIAEADISVEVVEIYPNLGFRFPSKLKEQGTCHVILKIGDLSMEIKNIRYQVRTNGGVWVGPPINIYPDHDKNRKSQAIKPSSAKRGWSPDLLISQCQQSLLKILKYSLRFKS